MINALGAQRFYEGKKLSNQISVHQSLQPKIDFFTLYFAAFSTIDQN